VLCSITGFGEAEGRDLPGYDLVLQAVGGLMSVTGPEPGSPTKVGVALVDVIAGLHAAVGILAALRHRDRTGEGQRVEISLLSSLLSGLVNQASGYVSAGVVPGILGNAHPSIAPYEVYQVADGHFVVAVGNDRQFAALCAVVERPDLAEDARFLTNADRVRNRDDLNRELSPSLGTRTGSQWFDALRAVGVPCGPINDLAGAFGFAEALGLEPVVEIADAGGGAASRQVRNPIGLSATPPRHESPPPPLGRDTEDVLRELGRAPGEPT
jgi:crotonobetainyl-CoA:carnitine CoA-transferase CaiB-like acyl-CoA transferase